MTYRPPFRSGDIVIHLKLEEGINYAEFRASASPQTSLCHTLLKVMLSKGE